MGSGLSTNESSSSSVPGTALNTEQDKVPVLVQGGGYVHIVLSCDSAFRKSEAGSCAESDGHAVFNRMVPDGLMKS